MNAPRPTQTLAFGLIALAIALTAAVRLQELPQLRLGADRGAPTLAGQWAVASGDSAYHARRIAWVSQHGQALSNDPWTHFPTGNQVVWPDGLDSTAGHLARLLGPPGDRNAAIWAGIALVTLLAAATAGLAAALALRLARRAPLAGLAAGLLIAFHPGLHNYTQAGKIDHHAAEPLFTFAAVAALLAAVEVHDPVARRIRQGLAAFLLVAALATWPSSALTVALVGGLAGVRLLLTAVEQRREVAGRLAWPLALAGLVSLPLGLLSPFGQGGAAVAQALSTLQPGLLLLGGAALLAAGQVRGVGLPGQVATAVVMAGAVALGLVLWVPGRQALLGGAEFVQGRGYVVLIQESMSAWETGLESSLATLSVPTLLLPWLAWHGWRRGADPELRVWVVAALATTGLAVAQIRFAPLAAVPLAALAAVALADLAAKSRPSWAAAALLALLVPGALQVQARLPPIGKRIAVWQALQWLQQRDPPRRDARQLGAKPDGAVLASWSYGHDLLAFGGRANVCSPLIAPGQELGLRACLKLALGAGSPREIEELLAYHQVRWWLTTPWSMAAMRAYAEALGLPAERYAVTAADGSVQLTRAGQCATGQHLWFANGSAAPDGSCQALPHWRLAYAAPGGGAKLFERVRGARLIVRGCPTGAAVRLVARLANGRQGWLWIAQATPNADGTAAVATPWSSGFRSDALQLLDQRLECGPNSAVPNVSEEAVQLGLTVDTSAAAAPP